MELAEFGVDEEECVVGEVKDDKAEDVAAAPHHGLGAAFGLDAGFVLVAVAFGRAVFEGELDGGDDVGGDGEEECDAGEPDEFAEVFEEFGVGIDLRGVGGVAGAEEDLEITNEMGDDEADHDEAGDGDDGFFTNR